MTTGMTPFSDGVRTFPALDGCMPASMGRRFSARIIDVGLGMVVVPLLEIPYYLSLASRDSTGIQVGSAVSMLLLIGAGIGVYVYFGKTGFLPGGRILGVRQVKVADGRPAGWAGVGKYALISLVSGVTCHIGYLVTILVAKKPLNRCWHDEVSGLVVLDVKVGRDPVEMPLSVGREVGFVPTYGPGPSAQSHLEPAAGYREAVVSVGTSAPAVRPSGLDETSLVSPLVQSPAPATSFAPTPVGTTSFTPTPSAPTSVAPVAAAPVTAPSVTPAGPVVDVFGDGMISSVPWSKGSSDLAAPAPVAPAPLSFAPPVVSAAPVVPAAPAGADDYEDRTVVSPDILGLSAAASGLALVSDNGHRIPLDKVTVVGRNPVAPADHPEARTHILDDSTMSVSKTHVVLGPDPDGVWVQDLRSTNGTAVTTANGMRTAVPAGGKLVAGVGATIHIGKVAFRVVDQ